MRNSFSKPNNLVEIILLCSICLATWYSATYNLDLRIAVGGFSPLHFIGQYVCETCFIGDFPIYDQFGVSLLSKIYQVTEAIGLETYNSLNLVIALEIFTFSSVIYFSAKNVFKRNRTESLFITILVMSSSVLHVNLGGWQAPIFYGLPYALALSLQIMGVMLFLTGRHFLCSISLCLSFATHPVIGGLGILFVAGMVFGNIACLKNREVFQAAVLGGLSILAWIFFVYPNNSFSGDLEFLTDSYWTAANRMANFHFYPDERGHFTTRADAILLPWIGALTLCFHYLSREKPMGKKELMVLGGLVTSIFISLLGITFSLFNFDPTLVKLTLIRATEFAATIGIFYIGKGLFLDLTSGSILRAICAVIIVASFFSFPRYPAAPIACLVLHGFFIEKNFQVWNAAKIAEVSLFIILVLVVGWFCFNDLLSRSVEWILLGNRPFQRQETSIIIGSLLLLIPITFTIVFYRLGLHKTLNMAQLKPKYDRSKLNCTIIILAMCILGAQYLWNTRSFARSEQVLDWARDYKAVQIWARNNTAPGTIFIHDPTIYYGWRDYSWRPSFGDALSWIRPVYISDDAFFMEGKKRLLEFDLTAEQYFDAGPDMAGYIALTKDLKEAFYSKKDEWFRQIGDAYDVQYVVLERKYMPIELGLTKTYSNRSFIVYSVYK